MPVLEARSGSRFVARRLLDYGALLVALSLLVAFFGWRHDRFLTVMTLSTVANQLPDLLVVTVGMTLVLIVGDIDLSVGSVAALSGAVLGWLLVDCGAPVGVSVAGALGVGLLCGAVNGAIRVAWNVPSFIVTLGMFEVARGTAYLVTGSQTKYLGTQLAPLADRLAFLPVSAAFLVAVGLVGLAEAALRGTVWGRYALALGCNEAAARLSGVHLGRVRLAVFLASGLLAGVAGVFLAARMSVADPNAGTGLELAAIAAVVVGGTSLAGGRGSVVGSFLGVLLVSVLQTGLAQMGVSDHVKRIITGGVIVAAVVMDVYRGRR